MARKTNSAYDTFHMADNAQVKTRISFLFFFKQMFLICPYI